MTEEFEQCIHGRLITGYCEPCAQEAAPIPEKPAMKNPKKSAQPSGLDAPYYDIPDHVKCIDDMIEWLDLRFGQANILKSIVREYNPDAKKETTALYEAQKRFYYAERHLRRVSKMPK